MNSTTWGQAEEHPSDHSGRRLVTACAGAVALVGALIAAGVKWGVVSTHPKLEPEIQVAFVPKPPAAQTDSPKPATPVLRKAPGLAGGGPKKGLPVVVPTRMAQGAPEAAPSEAVVGLEFDDGTALGAEGGTGTGSGTGTGTGTDPVAPGDAKGSEDFSGPSILSEDIEPARPLSTPLPPYPASARAAGAEASIEVELVIASDGQVREVRFVRTHPLFEASVRSVVMLWTFRPASSDGIPTTSIVTRTFVFQART